jgi:hypothetical protein
MKSLISTYTTDNNFLCISDITIKIGSSDDTFFNRAEKFNLLISMIIFFCMQIRERANFHLILSPGH